MQNEHYRSVLLAFELEVNRITQYVIFCTWLLLHTITVFYLTIISLIVHLEVGRPEVWHVRALIGLLTIYLLAFPGWLQGGSAAPDLMFSHNHSPRKEAGTITAATEVPFARTSFPYQI